MNLNAINKSGLFINDAWTLVKKDSSEDMLPWQEKILVQDFFADSFTQLCDEDRTSLVKVTHAMHTFFLELEKKRLTPLMTLICSVKHFCAARPNLTNVAESINDLNALFRSPFLISIPKVDDTFFTAIRLLLAQLRPLDNATIVAFKRELLAKETVGEVRGIYRYIHDKFLDIAVLSHLKEIIPQPKVMSPQLIDRLKVTHLPRINDKLDSWDCLKRYELAFEIFSYHPSKLPPILPDDSYCAQGYLGQSLKGKFSSLIPFKSKNMCIDIIGTIAAKGHFEWAMKVTSIMLNKLEIFNSRPKGYLTQVRDEIYIKIASESKFHHAYFLLDEILSLTFRFQLVNTILTNAFQYTYEVSTEQIIGLLQTKAYYTAALQAVYQQNIAGSDEGLITFESKLSATGTFVEWLILACTNGWVDIAQDMVDRMLPYIQDRLYKEVSDNLISAYEKLENFEAAAQVPIKAQACAAAGEIYQQKLMVRNQQRLRKISHIPNAIDELSFEPILTGVNK